MKTLPLVIIIVASILVVSSVLIVRTSNTQNNQFKNNSGQNNVSGNNGSGSETDNDGGTNQNGIGQNEIGQNGIGESVINPNGEITDTNNNGTAEGIPADLDLYNTANGTAPRTNPNQNNTNTPVPLPSPEYLIGLFFDLINEDRIPEAIKLMSVQAVPDDATKQTYGVQFNEVESIKAVEIVPSDKANWTNNQRQYKVKITVQMSPESVSAVIPYYGWDSSPIYKWITVTRPDQNTVWKIDGISSGP